jgi:ankyrin repeat protein
MTALHYAAREGNMDAVRELVAAGADINQVSRSEQTSAMTEVIFNGHFDIAKFLLDHGADDGHRRRPRRCWN